jgi:hypothetical protein
MFKIYDEIKQRRPNSEEIVVFKADLLYSRYDAIEDYEKVLQFYYYEDTV